MMLTIFEFGEYGYQALVREFREELDAEINEVHYFGTLENIFTYKNERGHEIVLLYHVKFVEPVFYKKEETRGREDGGEPFKAVWKSLVDFQNGKAILYPTGLLELLMDQS